MICLKKSAKPFSLLVISAAPSNRDNYGYNHVGHDLSLPSKRLRLKTASLCEFSVNTNSLFFTEYACCLHL